MKRRKRKHRKLWTALFLLLLCLVLATVCFDRKVL